MEMNSIRTPEITIRSVHTYPGDTVIKNVVLAKQIQSLRAQHPRTGWRTLAVTILAFFVAGAAF